jgi:hypothetical protein
MPDKSPGTAEAISAPLAIIHYALLWFVLASPFLLQSLHE